jgi:hypothetical protein
VTEEPDALKQTGLQISQTGSDGDTPSLALNLRRFQLGNLINLRRYVGPLYTSYIGLQTYPLTVVKLLC